MTEPIVFALGAPDGAADGDLIRRSGVIFRTGDYPDKDFSLDADEARAAVEAFAPCPIDLEHVPTVLDGKLGVLEALALDADGATLTGVAAFPRWLDAALGDAPRKVSAAWNRTTKRLEKLALVRDPRVSDAALMSAYAAFAGKRNNAGDQKDLQSIHDLTAGLGAQCAAANVHMAATTERPWDGSASRWPSTDAYCASCLSDENPAGADKVQALCHLPYKEPDGTVNLNALRNAASRLPQTTFKSPAAKAAASSALNGLLKAHGIGAPATASANGGTSMKLSAIFGHWFAAGSPDPATFEVDLQPAPQLAAPPAPPAPATPQPDPQLTAMAAQMAALRAERTAEHAAQFYASLRDQHKVLTSADAEKAVIAAFTQAEAEDAAHGPVTFADGTQQSRVAQLQALFAQVPESLLGRELVPGAERALPNRLTTPDPNAPAPLSPEKLNELLAMTPLGAAALRARTNGAN